MAEPHDDRVEILSAHAPPEGYLARLFDPAHNVYFSPCVPGASCPNPQALSQIALAVLDTGLLSEHPYLRGRVQAEIDFTGEGPEDRNGHGSTVALLALSGLPTQTLLNVKVMNAQGQGKPDWLMRGLDWCADWARTHRQRLFVNLSCGVYHKRWGLRPCDARCNLCEAAKRAAEAGAFLMMAAGNAGPDQIPCPQRGALQDRFTGIVVAAGRPGTQEPQPYSGPGNYGVPEPPDHWEAVREGA